MAKNKGAGQRPPGSKAGSRTSGDTSAKRVKKKASRAPASDASIAPSPGKPSSLLDTRVIYCGDCLEKLADLPDNCVDLIYIDPPFNSNRNYEAPGGWGETKEKR